MAIGLIASGCSIAPYAAVVNGQTISVSQLNTELQQLTSNSAFVSKVVQSQGSVFGQGPGTYNATFVTEVLNRRVSLTLLSQALARRHIIPAKSDLAIALPEAQASYGGAAIFNQFPKPYQLTAITDTADIQLLEASLEHVSISAASLVSLYNSSRVSLTKCESTELGSGFRIAMRDLEIRGAGNLLGESQSGHMAAVGYDLYVKMVQEAVAELKGEKPEPEPEINLDIPAVANIPDSYIEREDLRLSIYRRLADARSLQDVDAVASELLDRFGPIPDQCGRLLQITRLRTRLIAIGVTEFVFVNLGLSGQSGFRIQPVGLPTSVQMRVKRLLPNATYRDAQKQLAVPVQRGSNMIDAAEKLVDILAPVEVSNAS